MHFSIGPVGFWALQRAAGRAWLAQGPRTVGPTTGFINERLMYLLHAFTAKVLDSRNYCLTVWSAKPAAVGAGIPARVPPVERIIYRHRRNQYVTLPELFFKYRYHFSCRELYFYYCRCDILAMRKTRYKPPPGTESHAAERREAAKARYKQGNHYGFADGETRRQPLAPALSPSALFHRPMGLRPAAAVAPSAAGSSAWGSSSWENSSWNDTSGSSWGSRWRQTSWGDARTREQDAAHDRR
jgi:hypothetical protein